MSLTPFRVALSPTTPPSSLNKVALDSSGCQDNSCPTISPSADPPPTPAPPSPDPSAPEPPSPDPPTPDLPAPDYPTLDPPSPYPPTPDPPAPDYPTLDPPSPYPPTPDPPAPDYPTLDPPSPYPPTPDPPAPDYPTLDPPSPYPPTPDSPASDFPTPDPPSPYPLTPDSSAPRGYSPPDSNRAIGTGAGISVPSVVVVFVLVAWYLKKKGVIGNLWQILLKVFSKAEGSTVVANAQNIPQTNAEQMGSESTSVNLHKSSSVDSNTSAKPPSPPINKFNPNHISPPSICNTTISKFTYKDIYRATNNFSTIIGKGDFGNIYRGVLSGGKEIAVKQMNVGGCKGEGAFQAVIETISHIHHKHLASLVGFCISETERLLVYDCAPNKTLEFHLHGKEGPPMSWENRMKVALGSAKGLTYLHEECDLNIIHCDINCTNIFLDEKFEPKVADFGLARFYSDYDTHVSTAVMGTRGYVAPECANTGMITVKSNVFSFGVVLLELITGCRPIDKSYPDDNIVDWARPLLTPALRNKNFKSVADPKLQNDYKFTEMIRMVACASACVRHSARERPYMSQITHALEGKLSLDDLNPSSHYDASSDTTSGSLNTTSYSHESLEKKQTF